ncbi:MAG: M20 peptidase family dipeptidase, partial [Rhodovarius sp.]|nr:M20 peptidase family dipeptidase [Rhodovarius sp.]
MTRQDALAEAGRRFDSGEFQALLARLVAIPSTSQEPGQEAALTAYLAEGLRPWLERLGFAVGIHPNPVPGFGPILVGRRIEDPSRPTILIYGHGDTVRGLEDQWSPGLHP